MRGECVFAAACKVCVCEFSRQDHTTRTLSHTETHGVSATGLATGSDRVRRETNDDPLTVLKRIGAAPPPSAAPLRSNPSVPRLSMLPGPEQITTAGPKSGTGNESQGGASLKNGDAPVKGSVGAQKGLIYPSWFVGRGVTLCSGPRGWEA